MPDNVGRYEQPYKGSFWAEVYGIHNRTGAIAQHDGCETLVNNTLRSALTAMFEDGTKLFRKNAVVREEFTFDKLHAMITGGRSTPIVVTNVNGTITDANTGLPIQEAIMNLSADEGSIQTTTDAGGKYNLPLEGVESAVSAILTASHPLYLADSRQITIVPNTDCTEDFGLNPASPTP